MKQKEREQLMEQKASLTEKEKSLDEGEKKLKHSLAAVLDLLMEENERMKSAVEKDDLRKVATAQLILDTATTKTGEYNQKLEEIRKKQKDFDHRKRKLLESCLDVNSEKKRKTSKEQKWRSYSERWTMNIFFVLQWTMKTIYYNLISIFSL